jgi:hypothetical protein
MIELQVEEEVDFDDAFLSTSFQMSGVEDVRVQDIGRYHIVRQAVTLAGVRRILTRLMERVIQTSLSSQMKKWQLTNI